MTSTGDAPIQLEGTNAAPLPHTWWQPLVMHPRMRVTVESPLNALSDEGVEENKRYARECMLDSLKRGEAPLASHLLYTQMLDDRVPEEREMGIEAGLTWAAQSEMMCFYLDRGNSPGMVRARKRAAQLGILTDDRWLGHT